MDESNKKKDKLDIKQIEYFVSLRELIAENSFILASLYLDNPTNTNRLPNNNIIKKHINIFSGMKGISNFISNHKSELSNQSNNTINNNLDGGDKRKSFSKRVIINLNKNNWESQLKRNELQMLYWFFIRLAFLIDFVLNKCSYYYKEGKKKVYKILKLNVEISDESSEKYENDTSKYPKTNLRYFVNYVNLITAVGYVLLLAFLCNLLFKLRFIGQLSSYRDI